MSAALHCQEIRFKAPLDYHNKQSEKIAIYGRLLFTDATKNSDVFVYLQGGPGFQCSGNIHSSAPFTELLKTHRVLLLDQRGTGKSSRISYLKAKSFASPKQLADYLTHFRADSIAKDAELARIKLKIKKWFLVGQSWGGFISYHYISAFPQSIKGAMLFGGVPPVVAENPKAVYQALNPILIARNQELYATYPALKKTVNKVRNIIESGAVQYPGLVVTVEKLQSLGMALGGNDGVKQLNDLFYDPFEDASESQLNYEFAKTIHEAVAFESNPIYAILHESIYCNGQGSSWAAQTVLDEQPKFSPKAKTLFFTAENIRRSDFQQYPLLKPFKQAAEILAAKQDWCEIYSLEKLKNNTVPIEAMVYERDLYVDVQLSIATLNATGNSRYVLNDTLEHNSFRTHGKTLVPKLLKRLLKRVEDKH